MLDNNSASVLELFGWTLNEGTVALLYFRSSSVTQHTPLIGTQCKAVSLGLINATQFVFSVTV